MNKLHVPEETRPEKVRVFGRNFYVNYPNPESGMTDLGMTHFHESLVLVRDGQEKIEERDTLLHEILHTIDLTMELELTERQVTCLAHALVGTFDDNPEFAKFVTENKELV